MQFCYFNMPSLFPIRPPRSVCPTFGLAAVGNKNIRRKVGQKTKDAALQPPPCN